MISAAIEEFPVRFRDWLAQQNETQGSLIYGDYKHIPSDEAAPNPLSRKEAQDAFPVLVVVHQEWRQIDEPNAECGEVPNEHIIELMIFDLLKRGEKAGIRMRRKTARLVNLFLQERHHRLCRDQTDPTNTAKFLWRPEDAQSTGFSLYYISARRAKPSIPLPVSEGLLLERGVVTVTARGLSREIEEE